MKTGLEPLSKREHADSASKQKQDHLAGFFRGHGANNLSKILHSQRIIMDKNNINNSSHALHVLRSVADFLRLRVINMYYKVTDGCLWVTTLFDL